MKCVLLRESGIFAVMSGSGAKHESLGELISKARGGGRELIQKRVGKGEEGRIVFSRTSHSPITPELKERARAGGPGSYMLHLTVSHFFDDKWVHVGSWAGWMVIISNIVNALAASIYFPFVVRVLFLVDQ